MPELRSIEPLPPAEVAVRLCYLYEHRMRNPVVDELEVTAENEASTDCTIWLLQSAWRCIKDGLLVLGPVPACAGFHA